jgi:hypothetical protein
MTQGAGGAGAVGPHETVLAQTYLQVCAFVRARALAGDPLAVPLFTGLSDQRRPPTSRAMVAQWLAQVASGQHLIRPDADPAIARQLLAAMQAAQRAVSGHEDRIWIATVSGIRSGQLRIG